MNPEQKQGLRKEQSAERLTVDSVRTRRDSWRAMGPATGPWHGEGRPVRTRRGENDLPCSLSASATASISRESDSPAFSFSAMRRENTQLFIRATISSCLSLRPAAIYFFQFRAQTRSRRRSTHISTHICAVQLTLIKFRVASNLVIEWGNNASVPIEGV